MEDSTLILIFDLFCLSSFLKGSPKSSPNRIHKTSAGSISILILGYDATASSKILKGSCAPMQNFSVIVLTSAEI